MYHEEGRQLLYWTNELWVALNLSDIPKALIAAEEVSKRSQEIRDSMIFSESMSLTDSEASG